MTLNKIFADEGLNEQRQIFRLPRDKLGVPPKETFSIFSQLSCSSPAWQFCRERLAHLPLPPLLAFASCSLHSSVQLCSTLRHFLPASASSRAPQLTKLTKINSKRGILKGINFFSAFFRVPQFLGAFCSIVKILHASCYGSGGLKLANLIQANGLKKIIKSTCHYWVLEQM